MKRGQRMHRGTLLIAIALLYIEGYEGQRGETYAPNAAFSRILIFKYFLISIRIAAELHQNRDSYLAALGTHLVEHFFALARFLMGGRGRVGDFRRAVTKAVFWKYVLGKLGVEVSTKRKSSDSGVRISATDKCDTFPTFSFHMKMALQLFKLMDPSFESKEGRWEAATKDEMDQVDVVGWLNSMFEQDAPKPREYQSLARLHVAPTGQTAQTAALAAHRSLELQRMSLEAALGPDEEAALGSDQEVRMGQVWVIGDDILDEERVVLVRRVGEQDRTMVQVLWGPAQLPPALAAAGGA
jgi:hypothetical protein